MRIAFLCKRRYMSKDVILDRYARLYEIPFQLARLGHDVLGCCMSYHSDADGEWTHEAAPGNLRWQSRSLGKWRIQALAAWPRCMLRELRMFKPDIVIGASDIPHVVLGEWLARKLGVPFAADLYDNFEGFGQARLPGFVPLLRRAVRGAALVSTTSEPLANLVRDAYQARGKIVAMPSTVDTDIFRLRNKNSSRQALGLLEHAQLVGTAGGLMAARGIGVLYEAWEKILSCRPDIELVLAGPADPSLPPPEGKRVHYLGMLSHTQTAQLFAALDVGVIYLADTIFGRYCFPQKACEMMACGLPIAGANLGVMPSLMANSPQLLYTPDDPMDLARVIEQQLAHPMPAKTPIRNWEQTIGMLEKHLRQLTKY